MPASRSRTTLGERDSHCRLELCPSGNINIIALLHVRRTVNTSHDHTLVRYSLSLHFTIKFVLTNHVKTEFEICFAFTWVPGIARRGIKVK